MSMQIVYGAGPLLLIVLVAITFWILSKWYFSIIEIAKLMLLKASLEASRAQV